MTPEVTQLDGTRIYLRLLSSQDTDLILRWRAMLDVANQLFSEKPPTRSEHEAWFSRLRKSDDRVEFIIMARENNFPIGTIGLSHIDRINGEAEYGVMIGEKDYRGTGLAREASEVLLKCAFESLGLKKVVLSLFADNLSALALYERLGFIEEPLLGGELLKNGIHRKTLTMVLTRASWEKGV